MAIATVIQIGVPIAVTQTLAYAMPIRSVVGMVSPAATAVLEGSVNQAFTVAQTIAQNTVSGQFTTSANFIRETAGGATIILKAT